MTTTGLPLAEFTALLTRQLTESATLAERRQRDEFVALAVEVEGTLEDYLERTLGPTQSERTAAAARYVTDIVGPLLPRSGKLRRAIDGDVLRLDQKGCDSLLGHFGSAIKDVLELGTETGTWLLERDKLERCALDKLRGEAEKRYLDVRTLLRTGVPRAQIRGGQLSVKVLLEETAAGSVVARLPPADAKGLGDVVSTLTLDFHVDAFPPFP